jgi:hypothetical protein
MLNKWEQEAIFLHAALESIGSILNKEVLSVEGSGTDRNVWFPSSVHRHYFFIGLVDFLSPTDAKAPVPKKRYLEALADIGNAPGFEHSRSVTRLKRAAERFRAWLQEEVIIEIWLASIEHQVSLNIPRLWLVKTCGNLSKHNYLRSITVAGELKDFMDAAGLHVELHEAVLAQEDVYERFHHDIGIYHSSTLAEFLNELCWGIHTYVRPQYLRSISSETQEPACFGYVYPDEITDPFAKVCYWNLMNAIRSGPIFQPFKVTKYLKGRY